MADVPGKFFSATKVRTGVSPSSPGSLVGEPLPPVNPPGTSLNSVGLTMPSAFTVANSPLTSNGTIGVTGAGTVGQYIRGDGSLADFPESSGGGSSVSYYLNGSVNQGTIGGVAYKELNKVPILGAGTDFTIAADGYIASFLTDAGDPNLLEIPGGNWNFETYFSASSSGGTPSFYVELYKYDGSSFTLIASSVSVPELIAFGTITTPYFSSLAVPTTTLALTDRLAVRYYVTPAGRTITLHTENNTLCQIITTFTTGLTALNGLTAQVQNLAVGTTGTDFNIASAVATHTFNLPTASATNRGLLSAADWVTFNSKQPAGNYVTLDTAQTITAQKTFTTSGSSDTMIISHGSGSGFALDVLKAGNGEAIRVTKTSGSGNAMTISGGNFEAGTIVKTGGTSSQFLKADGSVDSNTYLTTATAASTYVPYSGATSSVNLGIHTLSANNLIANGGGNSGALLLKQSNSAQAVNLDYTTITPVGTTQLIFSLSQSSGVWKSFVLHALNLTNNTTRTYTLPDASGTIALVGGTGVGTVTSVAALTLGTSGTDLSSTVANGTTTPVITLNVPTASAANRGALSAADWTTFNNKQNALTNPVTGTGTTNYLPKFTGASTIGNSNLINDASGNLGLGVTPSAWVSNRTAISIKNGAELTGFANGFELMANAYNDGSWKYIATSNASGYQSVNGAHFWYSAPSGTAGNAISFTQAMTLFSTGNLLVGTPSPISDNGARLQVSGTATFTANEALKINANNSTAANNTITGFSADLYAVAVRQKGASAGISGVNFMAQIISAVGAEGLEIYTPNSKELVLGTNSTARLTIGTTGAATFSSTVETTGIKFPATQVASADANTLDDYEEGTWTPTFNAAVTISGTPTGKYTKVGRLVYITCPFTYTALTGGDISISGLPYANAAIRQATVSAFSGVARATNQFFGGVVEASANNFYIEVANSTSGVSFTAHASCWYQV